MFLIDNAKSTMSYSEQLLQNAELIKSKFSEHHITHYLQLLFELLSGSLSAIYEVCSDIKICYQQKMYIQSVFICK